MVRSTRSHIVGLDGLRALAAFAVVVHHVAYDTGASFRGRFGIVYEQLDIGVAVFFVLSGFLLGGPFVRRLLDDRPIDGIGSFWWRRAVRIYPAYWVVLTVMVLFLGTSIDSWRDGILLYGLAQIYDPSTFYSGMVQVWTLCVEISFYAVLPLLTLGLAWSFRRLGVVRRERALLVACAVGYALSTIWRLSMYLFPPPWSRLALYWLPGQFDLFALGIALVVLREWAGRDGAVGARVERWVRRPGWWLAAAVAVFTATCVVGLRRPAVKLEVPMPFGDGREFARQLAFGLFAALLLAPFALRRSALRGPASVFGWRPMVVLGVLSYGVYLWHKALIVEVQSWFGLAQFDGGFLRVLVVVAALATALAWLTWHAVERPSLRLARRGSLRVAPAIDAPGADGATEGADGQPGQPPLGSS